MFFVVDGIPVPKMRPRVTYSGHAYTPEKTKVFESRVKDAAMQAMGGCEPLRGAVRLDVRQYFPIPVSWPKQKRQDALNGGLAHTVKPDADNVYKSVADALNGVAYVDDVQVVSGGFTKRYSERPRVEITVTKADEVQA